MMGTTVSLLAVLVSSAVIENLLFARALGADHIIKQSRSYRLILALGAGIAIISSLSVIPLWWMARAFARESWWNYLLCFSAVCLVAVFNLGITVALAMTGKLKRQLRLLDQGAVYSASLAVTLLSISSVLPLLGSLLYCLGASAGMVAAMMLVHSGRERLEFCNISRSFSGLPITMIYIGILSLAIYGLIGHQLPT